MWQINTTEYPLYQKHIIYPKINNFLCTAMLLTNLTDPEWITVGCNESITNHLMCFWKEAKKKKINQSTKNIYNEMCVLHNDTCYLFEWRKTYNTKLSKNIGSNISNITLFQHVFNAVSVTFLPIVVDNSRYMMTFRRYGHVFHMKK